MRKAKILLVEDETDILEQNRRHLAWQGYDVDCAATLADARERLHSFAPDLILLDVMMPDGSGYDFCAEIRPLTAAPIVYLTCLDNNENIVHGLTGGGDDYITKPFSLDVLSARVLAHLRRAGLQGTGRIEAPPLSINLQSGQAFLDGEELPLTQKELQLLAFFATSAGRKFSVEQLYQGVWGGTAGVSLSAVKTHISNLRRKLETGTDAPFAIRSVRGEGYVFTRLIEEAEW